MNVENLKTSVGYLLSGGLVTIGTRSLLDPVSASKLYGIPTQDSTSSYVPAMGIRNIAIGTSIGALILQGQKRAAGTVLATGLLVGLLDAWITYRFAGRWTAAVSNHVLGDGLAAVAGLWLWYG